MTTHFIFAEKLANLGKFQYMLLGKEKSLKIEIEEFQLESVKSVKLLGITTDHSLTFDTYVSNICKTASAKVKSLKVQSCKLKKHW